MHRLQTVTALSDLSNKLDKIATDTTFEQTDFKHLHKDLNELYEGMVMESLYNGHPNWSIVSGVKAVNLFLLRNWHFHNRVSENRQAFKQLADELRHFHRAQSSAPSSESIASIMKYLDVSYNFSSIVLAERHVLIFCLDYEHTQCDSFCRTFERMDGKMGADVYMLVPSSGEPVAPQCMFLHEMGHVLNTMRTGDIDVVPRDFVSTFEKMFTRLKESHTAKELFANCFAMGIMSHPKFQQYDPFLSISPTDKALFDKYFRLMIKHWSTH